MALASIVGTYAGGSEAIGPDVQATFDSFLARINAVTLEQMTANSVGTSQVVDANVTLAKLPNNVFTVLNGMDKFEDKAITRDKQAFTAKGAGAYIRYSHILGNGVDGGTALIGWNTRVLTASVEDTESTGAGTPDGSGVFILQAGDYRCHIVDSVYAVSGHMARLKNNTSGLTLLNGTSGNTSTNTAGVSTIAGKFTVAATQSLVIQHYATSSRADNGMGFGVAGTGDNSLFCIAEFWKVA